MTDLRATTLTRPASTPSQDATKAMTPPAWAADGVCASPQYSPELWHPRYISEERQAIALCHTCPMLAACDKWATDNDERWGVWGGRARGPRRGGVA